MCEAREDLITCKSFSGGYEEFPGKKCVPTQTQVRKQLGSKLSDVFFENLSKEGCIMLGLKPPLVGPDNVWVNPQSRTENNVSLSPVPEPASLHLKALTHGSVLEIGEKYITMLENKHRIEMEEALKNQREALEDIWKRKLAAITESDVGGESVPCTKVVATLMTHFDNCFNDLVYTTEMKMRKECRMIVEEERAELAAYMLTQVQEAVDQHDMKLCNDFHEVLYSELNALSNKYINQINDERKVAVELLKDTVRKYEKKLQDLRIEMEYCSVVDVCRAITRERIECNERVRKAEHMSRAKEEQLLAYIKYLQSQNCILQNMSKERMIRLLQWRKKVQLLLQEFQKFINFALKSVPGQSEFLLSLDNLLLKNYPEDMFLCPKDYQHFKDCLKDRLPPSNEGLLKAVTDVEESCVKDECDGKETKSSEKSVECYCSSIQYHEKEECNLNFDYDTFKSMLVSRYASDIKKPKIKKKRKKAVCIWRKKSPIDMSCKMYQTLTLVGENEREHADPVDVFLQKRLNAVLELCKDDPEFAKIMLGCLDN